MGEVIEKLKGGVSIAPNDYIEDGYRTIPKGAVNDTGVADMSACKNVSVDFFEKNYFSKTSTGELITSLRDLVPSAPNLGRIVRIVGQFEEFIMPQGVYSLKITDNLLEDFLIAYSNNYIYRSVIQSEKNGSTQVHIRNGEFLNIKIQVPSLPEQEAIGSFFSTLDRHITLHQRKLDKLKSVKQAYLSEMFPAEGERVPKRRFPGFTDDWELRKLGEYSTLITKGTTPRDKSGIGVVNFVKVENLVKGDIIPLQKIQLEEHEGYLKRSQLIENDILFSIAGTLGRTAIVKKSILPANTNQALSIIRGYEFDRNFLVTILRGVVVREFIKRNPTIGAQPNLSLEQVSNLCLLTPCSEEQSAIGTFFSTLDQHITLHQRKLEKLKNLKKALLNELFV